MTKVTAIVLAWGEEPYLSVCVDALHNTSGVDVEIIVVDNGVTDGSVEALPGTPMMSIIRPGRNTGFAGGCNIGAAAASGDVYVFVNSDAVAEPDALSRLAAVAVETDVGIATASVRLAGDPTLINSVGNPVHFLGVVWAGGYGEPAADHRKRCTVASASGAAMAVRAEIWDQLGGFPTEYFAYHEDAELSLRAWQAGLRVVYVPDAVVLHHYEFSRNARKQFLLERNRWLTLLTVFPTRILLLTAPALLCFEAAVTLLAVVQGWAGAKTRGWVWILQNRRWIAERRAAVKVARRLPDKGFAELLSARIEPRNVAQPSGVKILNAILSAYWAVVRRLV